MNEIVNVTYEQRALSYLPIHISECIRRAVGGGSMVNEIRITEGAKVTVVTTDADLYLPVICSGDDMRYIVRSLCGNSVYSHSESIKEGYITTSDGVRAGIAGRAVCEGGRICAISHISSVVIRIPHRFEGMADELYCIMERFGFKESVLIYSQPGGGKTTMLRELAALLDADKSCRRVVVVDSRCEISTGLEGAGLCILSGYPRHKGIEIAVRTLGASIVICDEISSDGDIAAALECFGSGVTLVASVHGTKKDVFDRKAVKELMAYGLFKVFYGIERSGSEISTKITFEDSLSS